MSNIQPTTFVVFSNLSGQALLDLDFENNLYVLVLLLSSKNPIVNPFFDHVLSCLTYGENVVQVIPVFGETIYHLLLYGENPFY